MTDKTMWYLAQNLRSRNKAGGVLVLFIGTASATWMF